MNKNVTIFDHPLITHKISLLRDERTCQKEFRELVEEIAMLMGYEALRGLKTKDVEIKTPICTTVKPVIADKITIVPILRAGLGMVNGIQALLPTAKVGHIGMYRDEDTLEPKEYYCKLPKDVTETEVFLLDPMLATGGSASAAVQYLKNLGCKHISLMSIVGAPVGIDKISGDHPDVNVYVGCCIVPGLGDAGDRLFGTK